MQPLVLDNSSSRKSHLIQRPGNKVLAWAWGPESSFKAWGAVGGSTVCSKVETNNRNGSRRSYRRNRNRINNISRDRIARRGRMSSLRHIISLLQYRSLCIEAFSGSSTWTRAEVAEGGPSWRQRRNKPPEGPMTRLRQLLFRRDWPAYQTRQLRSAIRTKRGTSLENRNLTGRLPLSKGGDSSK